MSWRRVYRWCRWSSRWLKHSQTSIGRFVDYSSLPTFHSPPAQEVSFRQAAYEGQTAGGWGAARFVTPTTSNPAQVVLGSSLPPPDVRSLREVLLGQRSLPGKVARGQLVLLISAVCGPLEHMISPLRFVVRHRSRPDKPYIVPLLLDPACVLFFES